MNSSRQSPCPVCSAKYPHWCGIKVIPKYRCAKCSSPAYLAPDGEFRHANDALEDASTFCDWYGYPVVARPTPDPGVTS